MQPNSCFTGTIYGGMGHLLYAYLQDKNYPIPAKLHAVQNLERFEFSLWTELLTDLDRQIQCPALGLEISHYCEMKHLGILAYISMACDTLGDAVQRYEDLHPLIFDGSPLELELLGNTVAVRWATVPMNLMTLVSDEVAMGAFLIHLNQVLHPNKLQLHSVHFAYPAPKNTQIYEDFFGCEVLFNQKISQIILPLTEFTRPFQRSDRSLQHLLVQQAEALVERLPHRASEKDHKIQKAILQGLQRGHFQIEHIAEQLHISVRQLQRQLQHQGTTFQQRVKAIRQMMAEQYLKDPHLSLQDIALLLGYSEQSAFQRAFKQWTQLTPQQWRQERVHSVTQVNSKTKQSRPTRPFSFEI